MASRFKSTENKFNRNPEIATKYKETVNSYIESGYARKSSKEEATLIELITFPIIQLLIIIKLVS